jgi:RHS repeat-associated protein
MRRPAEREGVITTVAGSGSTLPINDGGPATNAGLFHPGGVAFAEDGSFYIADSLHHRIRHVDRDGIITTVAGTGVAGSSGDGGPATLARLNRPYDVRLGPDQRLYIADYWNRKIRRINLDGTIETVAGTGIQGHSGDGGPATQAKLAGPWALQIGPDCAIYFTDTDEPAQNHRYIRRISPDGIITTVAGTGAAVCGSAVGAPAAQTPLFHGDDIALAGDGSIYYSDCHSVRRINPDGLVESVVGTGISGSDGDGGPATAARIEIAASLELGPDGSLYILDFDADVLRKVDPAGIITTVAGVAYQAATSLEGAAAGGNPLNVTPVNDLTMGPDGALYLSNANGARVSRIASPFRHDPDDPEIRIAAEDGRELYVFDREGRHLRTTHALTGATRYEFDYLDGRLIGLTDAYGNTTTIERDASGNPLAIVAPTGQRTAFTLNPDGYLATITNPAGDQIGFGYEATGLLTDFLDARHHQWLYTHVDGRLVSDADPAGGLQTLTRTELPNGFQVHHVVATTATESIVTRYTVEDLPNGVQRRTTTHPSGLVTEGFLSPDGTRGSTAPDGTVTEHTLRPDPRFGMQAPLPAAVSIDTPDGLHFSLTKSRTAVLSDPANPMSLTSETETVTINGKTVTSVFSDGTPDTITTTSAAQRQTVTTLDALARPVKHSTTGLHPLRREYDPQGRLSTLKHGPDPDTAETRVTTFTYKHTADAQNGYLDTILDAENRTTGFTYDDAGRVTSQTLPDGRVIGFGYDANGNVTSITPPGRPAHTFDYTVVNLEETYTPPNVLPPFATPQTEYAYTLDRKLDTITRPDGGVVDFDYESGRLDLVTLPGNEVRDYAYYTAAESSAGNLKTIVNLEGGLPTSTLAFTYDGSLLRSEQWSGPGLATATVTHGYTNDFRLQSLQVNAEPAISFGYDDDGLLTQAGAVSLVPDPANGLLTGTSLVAGANTLTDTIGYTPFGEPQTYTAQLNGTPLYSAEYDPRDKLGRIVTKAETITLGGVPETVTRTYQYDAAGRLRDVHDGPDVIAPVIAHYEYDSNGNRQAGSFNQVGGALLGATYDDQDRLTSYETALGGAVSFTYTPNGELLSRNNLTTNSLTTYSYDALGNLRRVVLHEGEPTEKVIDYLVDGKNRRIGKKVNGVLAQQFLYKDQLEPVAELDGSGNLVAQFVYGSKPNVPDYMLKNGTTYRVISDHLGSPRLVVNVADGSVTQRTDYDEFGNVLSDTSPGFQPFGFAGGIYDADTGLVRFGARDYDPQTGRWTAKDPILFYGSNSNLYGYGLNDPINRIDLAGTAEVSVTGQVGPLQVTGNTQATTLSWSTPGLGGCVSICSNAQNPGVPGGVQVAADIVPVVSVSSDPVAGQTCLNLGLMWGWPVSANAAISTVNGNGNFVQPTLPAVSAQ